MFDLFEKYHQKMMKQFDDVQKELSSAFKNFEFPSAEDPTFNYTCETKETETHLIKTEKWTAKNGIASFSRTVSEPKFAKRTEEDIRKEIQEAVNAEDYRTAAKLKDELEEIKKGA